MENESSTVDIALMQEYIDESLDTLSTLTDLFVQLENAPHNLQLINDIFRPIHSIKGNSAFFGVLRIKELAHRMEDVLDAMRNDKLQVTPAVISVLLQGVDALTLMFERVANNDTEVTDETKFATLLTDVSALLDGPDTSHVIDDLKTAVETLQHHPAVVDSELTAAVAEIAALVAKLGGDTTTQGNSDLPPALVELRQILATPFDGALPEDQSKRVCDALEALQELAVVDEAKAVLADATSDCKTMIEAVGFEPLLAEILSDKLEELDQWEPWWPEAREAEEQPATAGQPDADEAPAGNNPSAGNKAKSMRISEEIIDVFLEHVGELIVVREMFEHLRRRLCERDEVRELAEEFRRLNESFNEVSNDLEQSVMAVRKQPVKLLLQKAPRIVRDLAQNMGKEIELNCEGDSVLVDKSLLDVLESPFVHMVRNAVDHGIELPDDRETSGKSRRGRIDVAVKETEQHLIMSVQDDGKGLNLDAIHAKAQSLGIVTADAELRDEDIIDCLFESGVSTAAAVTDVSGRGVGMDVVKQNVENAGGRIFVDSTQGNGTQMTIQLPKSVTTQIINGFIVDVGGSNYVVPVSRVVESFPPDDGELSSVHDRQEVVRRHGKILPVLRLRNLFGGNQDESKGAIFVTLEERKRQIAVLVDNIIGIQQVVLKPLSGLHARADLFAGGALMGDGEVSLIIDVERLFAVTENGGLHGEAIPAAR